MIMKDILESQRVRKSIRAKRGQCYYNAFQVIHDVPEYAEADYVEGFVVRCGVPIEHGWVEKDGVIVDPTLPEDEVAYFPGLRFQGASGLAEALQIPKPKKAIRDLPIFCRFGWDGLQSPEFRAANVAAYRHADWKRSPSKSRAVSLVAWQFDCGPTLSFHQDTSQGPLCLANGSSGRSCAAQLRDSPAYATRLGPRTRRVRS